MAGIKARRSRISWPVIYFVGGPIAILASAMIADAIEFDECMAQWPSEAARFDAAVGHCGEMGTLSALAAIVLAVPTWLVAWPVLKLLAKFAK